MKTYEPRRNNACPNGLHADYDPAKDPSLNECTCPWLIIQSSTPVQHLTSWNRRETENFIREVDRGYFDPPGYPKRTGSMFLSPAMQRLLDVAEKEPIAAALTLLAGSGSGLPPFDAVAWDAEDACLSVRVPGLGWRRLWLGHANVEAVTDSDFTTAGGASPVLLWADHPDTARETALPKLNAAWHHEQCACDLNDPQQQAGCQRADEFSAAYLPEEVSGDVYAEDVLPKVKWSSTTLFVGDDTNMDDPFVQSMIADPTTSVYVHDGPLVDPALMAQDADDVAANSATARIMGDYMPLILTVPADEIENLRAGNPVFDEAMRQAQEGGCAGFAAMPEEMTFPEGADPTIVANIEAFLADPSTGVRRERPLPRRVPQVPSDIAQASAVVLDELCSWCGSHHAPGSHAVAECVEAAGNHPDASCDQCGKHLTAAEIIGDMTAHDCALPDRTCVCDIRGSAPDTYSCPEHGNDTM